MSTVGQRERLIQQQVAIGHQGGDCNGRAFKKEGGTPQ